MKKMFNLWKFRIIVECYDWYYRNEKGSNRLIYINYLDNWVKWIDI